MEGPDPNNASKKEIISYGAALGLMFAAIWFFLGVILGVILSVFLGLGKGFQYSLFVITIVYFLADFVIGLVAFFNHDKISEGIIFCLGTSPFLGIISGLSFFDVWTGISFFVGFNIIFSLSLILTTMVIIIIRVLRDLAYSIVRAIGGLEDDDDEEEEPAKA
jgi:hypothetical protein